MKRAIRVEKLLPYPPERVWNALTDARLLGAWLMPNDFEPSLHKQFTFRMKPQRGWDGVTHCEVIELEPEKRLAFTYRGEATGEKTLACATAVGLVSEGVSSKARKAGKGIFTKLDTILRFTLSPEDRGGQPQTRLRMEHEGFKGLKLILVSFVMGAGWKKRVLPRLEAALEQARDSARAERGVGGL